MPMAACSAACSAPGTCASSTPEASRTSAGTVHHTAFVVSERSGRSSGWVPSTSPDGSRRMKPVTWVVTRTRAERHVDAGPAHGALAVEDVEAAHRLRARRPPGVAPHDVGGARLEVELGDDPRVALVDVHRPGVDLRVRGRLVDGAEDAAGAGLDDGHDVVDPSQRDVVRRTVVAGPEPPGRAPAQDAPGDERVDERPRVGTEHREVVVAERQLRRGGREVRPEHVGVVRVHDRRLDRGAEDRLGVADEVGVERVVGRDEHGERLLARAPRPARLLPQAGPPPGPAGHDDGVEPADVDPELEGVRRRQPAQRPRAQPALELAPLLGEVAAAVGRHALAAHRVLVLDPPPGVARQRLGAGPAAREGHRLDAVEDEGREDLGGLGRRRAALAVVVGRGLPQGEGHRAPRRPVLGDRRRPAARRGSTRGRPGR